MSAFLCMRQTFIDVRIKLEQTTTYTDTDIYVDRDRHTYVDRDGNGSRLWVGRCRLLELLHCRVLLFQRFFCIKFIIGMHFLCGGQGERRTVSLIYRKGVLQCTTSRASGRSEAAKLLHHLLQASYCLEQRHRHTADSTVEEDMSEQSTAAQRSLLTPQAEELRNSSLPRVLRCLEYFTALRCSAWKKKEIPRGRASMMFSCRTPEAQEGNAKNMEDKWRRTRVELKSSKSLEKQEMEGWQRHSFSTAKTCSLTHLFFPCSKNACGIFRERLLVLSHAFRV
ncbi:hypothetical protein TGGT1_285665 [Toxoplasma gondii GT1]|uniref:Uncharacterized protein n=3 Tax=Toxoplasma gondii TaxID=5811 RepID=S7UP00_TOXGG|nr:hypothetical protein TGGT1_285665 [Toxoplasma gondii GT1]KFG54721.1 hypothetical protein TGFOU_285665 [Toxoplasma gondii FOU]PUA87991.1 hypothetical protein TGBR9_285665 [Toxoplasma gondii TgCATBr9]